MFLKEVVEKVGDKVGKQSTSERVEHFAKHGTLYLFFEMINLRQEVERLKRELSTNE